MTVLISVAVLIVVMVGVTVATMEVEERTRRVRPRPPVSARRPSAGGGDRGRDSDRDGTPVPPTEPLPAPVTVLADPTPTPVEVGLVLDAQGRADRLCAVLLAAYAASRGPEANRAAAWVTPAPAPVSDDPRLAPGAQLRNRPARVAQLLRATAQGSADLELDRRVDIARGLRTRPPRCATLAALGELWQVTRSGMAQLGPCDVLRIREAVSQLRPLWADCVDVDELHSLAQALDEAAAAGADLRILVLAGDAPLLAGGRPSLTEAHDGRGRPPHGVETSYGSRVS